MNELIDSLGGIDKAKNFLVGMRELSRKSIALHTSRGAATFTVERLEEQIKDYERKTLEKSTEN